MNNAEAEHIWLGLTPRRRSVVLHATGLLDSPQVSHLSSCSWSRLGSHARLIFQDSLISISLLSDVLSDLSLEYRNSPDCRPVADSLSQGGGAGG